jgi:hypothetical protein
MGSEPLEVIAQNNDRDDNDPKLTKEQRAVN